jgi:hypothetical protein
LSKLRSGFSARRPLLAALLALALLLPVASSYAESFSVTTNKDLYTSGEKAIIVGLIPETAPEGYAVLLRVAGPENFECAVQNVLPDSDRSFVSRPLDLEECGIGQYTVMAYYADFATNSTFVVSNSTQTGQANRLELRLLKSVAIQAQETVNQRLREFLESSQVLPEDIADKYSLGVFEASLVLQAVEFGNTAEAKKHLIFTVKHFRQVLNSLAEERIVFEQIVNLEAASDDSEEVLLERYERIKEFYFRLEEVAQKNGVDNEDDFGRIVSLLARSKEMIDEGEFERAGNDLERANDMLESIRQSLYRDRNSGSSLANSTEKEVDVQARRLSNVADRFERDAYGILEDNPGQSVNATIQTVLGLISEARRNIENEDYTAARGNLSEAFSALDQAKHMMNEGSNEHDDQDSGEDSKGPSGGEEKEENGESGNNSTDSGENRGSGKDNEDDDQ